MPLDLFAEAGPLARGYLAVDWANTPLGAMATWPPCLRAALAACLTAPGPALLVWGPERVVLPNGACRDLLGDEAPAPGAAGPRWGPTFLRALLEAAHAHDRGARLEERPFARARGGAREELFVTCACAPVRGEGGARAGLHVALEDVTRRVLAGRRAATLAALAALEGEVDEVLAGACAALVDGEVGVRAAGMAADDGAMALAGGPALPAALEAARGALEPSPARASERPGVVAGAPGSVTLVLRPPGDARPRAALALDLSPLRPLDAEQRAFLEAAGRVAAAALGAARAARATAALRDGEERLRDALEAADMGTWRRDLRTDLCARDAGLNRLLGLEPAPMTAPFDDLLRRVHPGDRGRVADEVARALDRRGECDVECRIVRPDGTLRWLRVRGRALGDGAGAPGVMAGALIDITERKRAEEALRASDERLRTAVWASGTGTYFWDLRSNRVHHDEGVRRLFAFSATEGGHIDDFAARVHDDDRGAWRSALERSARDGADLDIEYRVVLPDGSVHWVLDRAKMVRDDAGLPTYMSGACLEITEQKRAQQALREADRRKDEFLAMLAHELRNPLAPIRTAVQLLRLRGQGPELARARDVIERQAEHLARLVDDLLEVSRITSGKIRLKREAVDLGAVVARAVEASRPLLDARRHALTVTAPDRPLRCEGDLIRLAQVLANLLNNAAKYTPEGGQVALVCEVDGGEAVLTVRDTGPGIPPDMLEKVFELFTQVDRSLDRAQGGLGIGLTLARRLVELHGGTLRARSDGAPGAALEVRLPLLPAAPPAVAAADAPPPAGAGRRVLVVDDNADAADTLAELLGVFGHATRAVHDGRRALEAAREAPPEVVFLDIGLPGMDGFEVARRLRAEHPGVVLVALTGYGQDDDVRRCREAGFDHHRVKPVDVTALLALLGDPTCSDAG